MQYKTVSRATFDRNIKSGKWIRQDTVTDKGCIVTTAQATRGVYNGAGKVLIITFSEYVAKINAERDAAEAAKNAAARANIIANGGRVI